MNNSKRSDYLLPASGTRGNIDKSSPSTETFWARVQIAMFLYAVLVVTQWRGKIVDAAFPVY